jgi:peptide/nickel transport system permease protein
VVGYVIRRLLWTATLLVIISFVTFLFFFVIPSDVATSRVPGASTTSLADQYQFEGESIPLEYVQFVWAVVRHGELGQSFRDRRPVTDKLKEAVPVTASLVIGGSLMWMLMAFPIGILSALRPRSLLDRSSMVFVLVGVSAHPLWIALVFSYVFGVRLHVMPIAGYCDFFHPSGRCGGTVQWAYHMMLPWLTFSFLFAALYARMIRASLIETLNEDYVRTAHAKGASRARVLRSHTLRNAMLPVITMLGMDVAVAFYGAIFIETAFGLPGIGKLLVDALPRRDLPVIMGVVLVVSVVVAFTSMIVDFAYGWLDPRVRLSSAPRERVGRARALRSRPRPKLKVTGSPTT